MAITRSAIPSPPERAPRPAFDPRRLVEAVTSVLPGPAALHEPEFAGREWDYVKECLDTGWVSSAGPYVERFEGMLAELAGVRCAVATVNGTAALHAALMLAGVRPGDEVIVPTLTFVGTVNAVAYCGAVPHFADSEARTLGLDAGKLAAHLAEIADAAGGVCRNRRTGRAIRAVIAMHTFGHPVDLDAVAAVCDRFGLALIEDAAESIGSYYKGRHTGGFGRIGILSFNGNKTVTTGGGGAILTNDEELGRAAKHLTTTAKRPHPWAFFHDRVGYNYRLPNINAALGCAQLEQLAQFVARKRRLAAAYIEALDGIAGIRVVREPSFATSNYWLNAVIAEDGAAARDAALAALNDAGFGSRPAWTPAHRLPMYRDGPRMNLDGAQGLWATLVTLPSSARLAPAGAAG